MQTYESGTWHETEERTSPQGGEQMQPLEDIMEYARQYARQKPEMAALICFGIGFVVGWRLKPW